ncbi:MAG: hypothetical protein ACRD3K_05490 [Edaphobacter sp.]
MMTMLEDVRLALRQIFRSFGLPGDAATAVSLIVLGVALNVVALRAVQYAGIGRHVKHEQATLRCAAKAELKVMRTVAVSTLRKIGDSGRRRCVAQQRLTDQQTERTGTTSRLGLPGHPLSLSKAPGEMTAGRQSGRGCGDEFSRNVAAEMFSVWS